MTIVRACDLQFSLLHSTNALILFESSSFSVEIVPQQNWNYVQPLYCVNWAVVSDLSIDQYGRPL